MLTDTFGKKGYKFSLMNDKEFCQLQDILKKKQSKKPLEKVTSRNKNFTSGAIPSKRKLHS